MTNRVYQIVELVGTSATSIEQAIEQGIANARKKYAKLDWFEVIETRGYIHDDKIKHYQVRLKIGYYEG